MSSPNLAFNMRRWVREHPKERVNQHATVVPHSGVERRAGLVSLDGRKHRVARPVRLDSGHPSQRNGFPL